MKFASVVLTLALALTGIGVGCGPEEKYCFEEHEVCSKAAIDKAAAIQAEKDRIAAELLDAGTVGDAGATVIGQ